MTRTRFLLLFFTALVLHVQAAEDDAEQVTKTLVWPDGTRYVGGVVDGRRTGKGTIFWQDGTRFVGQFENDMRNGPGTMILPDGTVYTGFFRDDELVDTESTLAAARNARRAEMDEETVASLGDTEMPEEADSLEAPSPAHVDEHDLLPEAEPGSATQFIDQQQRASASASSPETEPVPMADPVQAVEPEPEPTTEEPVFAESAEAAETDPFSTEVTELTDTVRAELTDAINLWAAAWSDQNVTQYLANYSDNFAVPGKQSRRNWEALRRTRLQRPRYIRIDIDYQGFELVDTNVAEVFFRQSYQSNTYSDVTDKVLRLRKEGTDWKILIERSR